MVLTVEPAPHEFAANFLFDEDGLAPFFAADSQVKSGGGSQYGEFTLDGERWKVKLYYQSSNIVHPGNRTPGGTTWRLEEMREFRLQVRRHPEEDSVGEQSFNAHIQPRWQGMEVELEDGTVQQYSVPQGVQEGINVKIQGSNIEFSRYLSLLRQGAAVVGIRRDYFETIHQYSNIQDAERYVRVHCDASGPVHARDGPIASMGHLLENDRQGYRKVVQNDDDEHGRNLPGYYHTVTLSPRRVREAFPDHSLPKEVKHYFTRHAAGMDNNNPLAHPKIGVSYQANRWDEKLDASEEGIARLGRELDQTLLSVLTDAGLDIAPQRGDGPFVEDGYFELKVTQAGPDPVGLDLTQVKSDQESIVIRQLSDGLSPVQWESLQTLVTDGDERSPTEIADEHGRHVGSVRRALRELEDLVEREYSKVSLRSRYIAELVHEAVDEAREATRRAADAGAKAIEASRRGLDESASAFLAWAARHGVDVDDALDRREARMTMRFGEPGREANRAIREGFRVWKDAGLPEERYRTARVRFSDGSYADAWRYLNPG